MFVLPQHCLEWFFDFIILKCNQRPNPCRQVSEKEFNIFAKIKTKYFNADWQRRKLIHNVVVANSVIADKLSKMKCLIIIMNLTDYQF